MRKHRTARVLMVDAGMQKRIVIRFALTYRIIQVFEQRICYFLWGRAFNVVYVHAKQTLLIPRRELTSIKATGWICSLLLLQIVGLSPPNNIQRFTWLGLAYAI